MGRNTPKRNRTDQSVAAQRLIEGMKQYESMLPQLLIGGTVVSHADLTAMVQRRVDAADVVNSTRATWLAAVQDERNEQTRTKALFSGLKQALLVAFAGQLDVLAAFGLTPPDERRVTPEQRIAAAAKARATRAARHTMGKRQKAAIKGTVALPASTIED
jgi:hypothetical protein